MPDWGVFGKRFLTASGCAIRAGAKLAKEGTKLAKKRYDDTRPIADMEEDIDRQSTRAVLTRIDEIMKAQIDSFIARAGNGGDFAQKIEKATKLKDVWTERAKKIKDKDIRKQAEESFKAELRTIFYTDPRTP